MILATCCVLFTEAFLGAPRAKPIAVQFGADFGLIGTGEPSDQLNREVSIAVNTLDPLNLVAGFHHIFPRTRTQECAHAFTVDGGQTWALGGVVPLQTRKSICFDPSVAGDGSGTFYYAYHDVNPLRGGDVTIDILVARSTDGGRSFPTFTVAVDEAVGVEQLDKPFIAVDGRGTSPFHRTIYLTYTRFGTSTPSLSVEIRVVVSRDGGFTWSPPLTLSPVAQFPDEVQGSFPVVGPDGAVYVFWADFRVPTGPLRIVFSKSGDGGATWSSPVDVATLLPSPGIFELKNANPDYGRVPNSGVLANSFPVAAITLDGSIGVVWVDFPQGSCVPVSSFSATCTNADVRLSISRDGGSTWTAPLKVSDEADRTDQFLPWLAVHPNGLLSISWLDRRLDPDNVNYDAFYTNTPDGRAFLPNIRVSSVSSLLGATFRIGDYTGLAAAGDAIHSAWPDLRVPSSPDVFTARGLLLP